MKLSNKFYDILKWFLMIFEPALITLIGTLAKIYGWDTTTLVLTISAVATFLGTITCISSINYYKDKEK